jgi:alcohol dehydrogenase
MTFFAATRAPREIVVGAGQRKALGGYARRAGARILIVTDEFMAGSPMFPDIINGLSAAGVEVSVFDRSLPEAPISAIDKAVELGKRTGVDSVLGLGGGSSMDTAKVAALLITHGGRPSDYYGEFKTPGRVMPLICMPTTAGTGSEVTPVAVIIDEAKGLKTGISSPFLIPEIAICDAELTLSCPPGLTAASGADAMTHAVEALMAAQRPMTADLTTSAVFVGKNQFSDSYALMAIRGIGQHLERAVKEGDNLESREGMMWSATLAGLAFGSAGTAAAHAIQYPLGAATHTAHGAGVACLLPYVMEFNAPTRRLALLQIADALGVLERAGGPDMRAYAAIDAIADLFARVGIPKTTREMGLSDEQVEWTATEALAIGRLVKNNPRTLGAETMHQIVRAAQSGDRLSLRKLAVLER